MAVGKSFIDSCIEMTDDISEVCVSRFEEITGKGRGICQAETSDGRVFAREQHQQSRYPCIASQGLLYRYVTP
jgi:hypothetical protein